MVVSDGFDDPLIPGLDFTETSDYAELESGQVNLNVTPAGNPGVFVTEQGTTLLPGQAATVVFTEEAGEVDATVVRDDNRRLATQSRLRFFHAAPNADSVDIYLLESETDLVDADPMVFGVSFEVSTGYFDAQSGRYELAITDAGTTDLVADIVPVRLRDFGLYEAVIRHGSDLSRVELLWYEDDPVR